MIKKGIALRLGWLHPFDDFLTCVFSCFLFIYSTIYLKYRDIY